MYLQYFEHSSVFITTPLESAKTSRTSTVSVILQTPDANLCSWIPHTNTQTQSPGPDKPQPEPAGALCRGSPAKDSSAHPYIQRPAVSDGRLFTYKNRAAWLAARSEVLPLAEYGVLDGGHVLRRYPVQPVPGGVRGAQLYPLRQHRRGRR